MVAGWAHQSGLLNLGFDPQLPARPDALIGEDVALPSLLTLKFPTAVILRA